MKIAWLSNAPWAPTGYGTQTAEIVPRIKAAGHDITILSNFGLMASRQEWNGITVLPQGKDKYSNDIVQAHLEHLKADWLITLYDVWPLERKWIDHPNVASWTPVDHQPAPFEVVQWAKTVRTIAMSRFGQRELKAQGVEAAYIPHSINTRDVFCPTAQMPSGSAPRKVLGVPADAFLVMVNAANNGTYPYRKSWPEMFAAMAYIQRDHPDVYLYVHTDKVGNNGINLDVLAEATGLKQERVRWADPYEVANGLVTSEALAAYYSTADVLLMPSMGEGFGIPAIEAQACGTPVILSNYSAQPELLGAGWLVAGQPFWNFAQRSWLQTPYIGQIVKALGEAIEHRGDPELAAKARTKAQEYDTDRVFDLYWRPFLAEMEATLKPPPLPPNREMRRAAKKRKVAA